MNEELTKLIEDALKMLDEVKRVGYWRRKRELQ